MRSALSDSSYLHIADLMAHILRCREARFSPHFVWREVRRAGKFQRKSKKEFENLRFSLASFSDSVIMI